MFLYVLWSKHGQNRTNKMWQLENGSSFRISCSPIAEVYRAAALFGRGGGWGGYVPDLFRATWQEVVGKRRKIYNFAGVSSGHHFRFSGKKRKMKKRRLKFLSSALCVWTLTVFATSPVNRAVTVQFAAFWYLTSSFPNFLDCGIPSFRFNRYRVSSSVVRRSEREPHHLPPSSVEVKNEWSSPATPLYPFIKCTGILIFSCILARDTVSTLMKIGARCSESALPHYTTKLWSPSSIDIIIFLRILPSSRLCK